MLAKWEPFSPSKLIDKSQRMHSQDSPIMLTHAPAYHRLSSNDLAQSLKNCSLSNQPDIIAENIIEEEEDHRVENPELNEKVFV